MDCYRQRTCPVRNEKACQGRFCRDTCPHLTDLEGEIGIEPEELSEELPGEDERRVGARKQP